MKSQNWRKSEGSRRGARRAFRRGPEGGSWFVPTVIIISLAKSPTMYNSVFICKFHIHEKMKRKKFQNKLKYANTFFL